ncbi:type IV conjugative transfer system protein TraL [Enterovibrio norvegicus]|uniref:type IV conjugative transfer system protein TraL n=1 Tax=Enterovibrio norvegicus TaxID=188144 RepID=UPI00352C1630
MAVKIDDEDSKDKLPSYCTYLPLRINDPQVVGFLDYDHFVVGILLLTVGNYFQYTMTGLFGGVAAIYALSYLRENFPSGSLFHILFAKGMMNIKESPRMPDPYKNTFTR